MADAMIERLETIAIPAVLVAATGVVLWLSTTSINATNERDRQMEAEAVRWKGDSKSPVKICIAQGGLPITNAGDGRLSQCQFGPEEVK